MGFNESAVEDTELDKDAADCLDSDWSCTGFLDLTLPLPCLLPMGEETTALKNARESPFEERFSIIIIIIVIVIFIIIIIINKISREIILIRSNFMSITSVNSTVLHLFSQTLKLALPIGFFSVARTIC